MVSCLRGRLKGLLPRRWPSTCSIFDAMPLRTLILPCCLCALAAAASAETPLEVGYRQMYDLQFAAAHRTFADWQNTHPDDPMGPASDAAAYLFAEFDRLRSEEHTSELQSLRHLVCRLLLEKKKQINT